MVIKCTCKGGAAADFQDKTYGEGMRVHTPMAKEPKGHHWRCTICRTEHSKGGSDDSKKKGKK